MGGTASVGGKLCGDLGQIGQHLCKTPLTRLIGLRYGAIFQSLGDSSAQGRQMPLNSQIGLVIVIKPAQIAKAKPPRAPSGHQPIAAQLLLEGHPL